GVVAVVHRDDGEFLCLGADVSTRLAAGAVAALAARAAVSLPRLVPDDGAPGQGAGGRVGMGSVDRGGVGRGPGVAVALAVSPWATPLQRLWRLRAAGRKERTARG